MLGETTKFTFDSRRFEVVEEIGDTNLTMDWTWNSLICPHCKEKIENIITHVFKVISILVPKEMLDKNADRKDLLKEAIMLGLDLNGKKLLLNKETQEKALKFSVFFKEVI